MTGGLGRFTVSRTVHPRLLTGGNRTGTDTGNGSVRLPERAGGNEDVSGLRDAAHGQFVRDAGAPAFQRGVPVAEGGYELDQEFLWVKGLFGQFGNGL